MKIIRRSYGVNSLESIIFSNEINFEQIIFDIDYFFKVTNKSFSQLLENLGLVPNFDFSRRDNKKFYTHEFIKTMCEFIKSNDSKSKFCFYSNLLTKDPFRNGIIKKIKTIFGFQIFEEAIGFCEFVDKIENNDAFIVSNLELLFSSDKKPKSMKRIKKHLEKSGLSYLNEIYFEDVSNKIYIIG